MTCSECDVALELRPAAIEDDGRTRTATTSQMAVRTARRQLHAWPRGTKSPSRRAVRVGAVLSPQTTGAWGRREDRALYERDAGGGPGATVLSSGPVVWFPRSGWWGRPSSVTRGSLRCIRSRCRAGVLVVHPRRGAVALAVVRVVVVRRVVSRSSASPGRAAPARKASRSAAKSRADW